MADLLTDDERAALSDLMSLERDERRALLELARHLANDAHGEGGGRNIDYLMELFRRRPELLRIIRRAIFWTDAQTILLKAGAFAAAITALATLWKVWNPWN